MIGGQKIVDMSAFFSSSFIYYCHLLSWLFTEKIFVTSREITALVTKHIEVEIWVYREKTMKSS